MLKDFIFIMYKYRCILTSNNAISIHILSFCMIKSLKIFYKYRKRELLKFNLHRIILRENK